MERGEIQYNPEETVLIIVDAQNFWFHPEGKMHLQEATNQIPTISNLASYFRDKKIPVIYTQVVWDKFEDVPLPLIRSRPQFKEGWVALKRGSFQGEIHSDLKPTEKDIVVEKKYFDVFQTGNLAGQLNSNIKNLVFVGTTLNNCVYSSLLGAAQRGFNTIAVTDGVSSFPGDDSKHWYSQMKENLGTQILTSKELIERLE